MLELYNHDMSVCAAKVRMVLAEKGLEWKDNYTEFRKGEARTPEYLAMNPNGVVPTLVHDGFVIYESNIICEYLDDRFPDPPLQPGEAQGRARVRKWLIQLDSSIHAATGVLSSCIAFRHSHLEKTPDELEAHFKRHSGKPLVEELNRENILKGLESRYFNDAIHRFDRLLRDLQVELGDGRPWLVDDQFSLADIGYASYMTRLEHLQLSDMWQSRPEVGAWYDRLRARPSYATAITDWFNKAYVDQMCEKGAEAWPRIKQILAT